MYDFDWDIVYLILFKRGCPILIGMLDIFPFFFAKGRESHFWTDRLEFTIEGGGRVSSAACRWVKLGFFLTGDGFFGL